MDTKELQYVLEAFRDLMSIVDITEKYNEVCALIKEGLKTPDQVMSEQIRCGNYAVFHCKWSRTSAGIAMVILAYRMREAVALERTINQAEFHNTIVAIQNGE